MDKGDVPAVNCTAGANEDGCNSPEEAVLRNTEMVPLR